MVLLLELLYMLWCGATCTGLEQSATVHEGNNRQHFGARADLQNREQIGQVIAKHVPGDRDRVLAVSDANE